MHPSVWWPEIGVEEGSNVGTIGLNTSKQETILGTQCITGEPGCRGVDGVRALQGERGR